MRDENILIIRGIKNFDELKKLGLPMARKVQQSNIIIGIESNGKPHVLKSRDNVKVEFIDAESQMCELAQIMKDIKDRYIAARPNKDAHLAHAIVGLWFFYWMLGGSDLMQPPSELAAAGDIDGVRESARMFIEADFGAKIGSAGKISDDGGSDTQTARVSSPVGQRAQAPADS